MMLPLARRDVGRAVQPAARRLCRLLVRLLPARRHAVVHGWPDDEGNAVETVRALGRRYRGTVYWLLRDTGYQGPALAPVDLGAATRVVRVPKGSVRALLLALTAETTFFTHGLFTAVDPPDDRLVVNLWHGDGPKIAGDTHLIRSTVVVAGTALWGAQRPQRFGVPARNVAVVGNPRVDQLTSAPRTDVLERLGLDPTLPTVLWLPTYRAAEAPRGRRWNDAATLSASTTAGAVLHAMSTAARERSVQLVVKPHPLDRDAYETFGIPVVEHARLSTTGVSLYQLLGAADAVISDVSSVWVDYLALDRPVGFYVPDQDELRRGRGLNVDDLAGVLPGALIESPADARSFVEAVASDPLRLRPSQHPAFARIGVVGGERVADRLLDWLDDFQVERGREALFTSRRHLTPP